MSTKQPADPDYRRELGDGLVLRWSTARDLEKLQALFSHVFRESPERPPNHYVASWVDDVLGGRHPLGGPDDVALVEDERRGLVVAASAVLSQSFEIEGLRVPVGRPEPVASHPDYRNRGLVRGTFELFHARSAARGQLVQAITGIPYYYRQFGYEYALDLGGGRTVPFAAIPSLKEGEKEPYTLRDATLADIPLLAALYERERARAAISTPIDETFWRWLVAGQRDESGEGWRPQVIVAEGGLGVGYVLLRRLRYGDTLGLNGLAVEAGASLAAVLPSVLRALRDRAPELPAWISEGEQKPPANLRFMMGRAHPTYDLLGEALTSRVGPPYAWYIRVPDVPALVRHIGPVLERRLSESAMANYSGELKLTFYRDGLRLALDGGRLTAAEPWRTQPWGPEADGGLPPLVFLQLLFGHRSLGELRHAFPDVWASDKAQPLIEALFPPRLAWALGLE